MDLSTRKIAQNTVFNLLGLGLPLVAALLLTPVLISELGTERYAVLTIFWALVGYVSLFDLGLGRALTKVVSERIGTVRAPEIPVWIVTALLLLSMLGILGAIVVAMSTEVLFTRFIQVPTSILDEATSAGRVVALAVPLVVLTAALRGVLEAYQKFNITNAIRTAIGIYIVASPIVVLWWTNSLVWIAVALVLGRLTVVVIYGRLCMRTVPALADSMRADRHAVWPLVRFGGWMSVTNIVSPLMVTMDRVLVGAFVTISAVAYYTTAVDMATRLLIVVSALAVVLFPAFSNSVVTNPARARRLYGLGITSVLLMLFPATMLLSTVAPEFIALWIDPEFSSNAALPLQILSIGVFFNGIANLPFTFLQSSGRPDLPAKINIIELLCFVPALWFMTTRFGIVGTSVTWTARMFIDMVLMSQFARRINHDVTRWPKYLLAILVFCAASLVILIPSSSFVVRVLFSSVSLIVFFPSVWFLVLSVEERTQILLRLRYFLPSENPG